MSRRSGAVRYRRTWPQRLLLATNVVAIVACVATAVVIIYARDTVADTRRTSILAAGGWQSSKEVAAGDPMNFLIVGTDDKAGLAADDPLLDGRDDVGGTRSDVIMIVRVDPKTSEAKVVSFPRDLWVTIPDHGQSKINASMNYAEGTPDKLIETLHSEFGITVNHYVEVNFAAFKKVIDVIGGVDIYISHPLRDFHSGLDQPTVGCRHLDAGQALAYARSRYLQWQNADGRWVPDPTADHGRVKRQKEFLQRVVAQAIRKGARNPATLNQLIRNVQGSVKLDRDMTAQDLLDLGRAFDSFEPGELETLELPVYDEYVGGQAVVQLRRAEAEPILEQFRGTDAPTPEGEVRAEDVTLRVVNGGAPDQAAAEATDQLGRLGFRTQAPSTVDPVERTQIRFTAAALSEARYLARHLAGDVELVSDPTVSEITLVLGPDHAGILTTPKPSTEIPANTVAASTTTTEAQAATSTTTVPRSTTTLDERGDPPRGSSYVPAAVPEGVSC